MSTWWSPLIYSTVVYHSTAYIHINVIFSFDIVINSTELCTCRTVWQMILRMLDQVHWSLYDCMTSVAFEPLTSFLSRSELVLAFFLASSAKLISQRLAQVTGVEGVGNRPVRIRQMSTSLRRKSSRSMSARVVAPRVCGSPVLLVLPACRHVIWYKHLMMHIFWTLTKIRTVLLLLVKECQMFAEIWRFDPRHLVSPGECDEESRRPMF